MTLFPGLNDSQAAALVETAQAIRTDPLYLWEVVNFESRHNPQASNPLSSAKGLVQFMDSTAQGLGFSSSQDLVNKYPGYEAQMRGPVRSYFQKLGSSFPTRQSLFMAVFMPVARSVPADTTFSDIYARTPSLGSAKYPTFVKQNPNITTVADYVNFVARAAKRKATSSQIGGGIAGVTVFAIIGTAAVFFSKGGRL